MMAKEVLEDSLLSFLTDDIPEVELDAETNSETVIPASVVVVSFTRKRTKFMSII